MTATRPPCADVIPFMSTPDSETVSDAVYRETIVESVLPCGLGV